MQTYLEVVMAVVLAVAAIAWITRLVLFFGFRFKGWRQKEANPFEKKETMGLPKGAMRTFLALAFTAITLRAMLAAPDLVDLADKKWLLLELGAIVTFYFGSKSLEAFVDSRAKVKAIEKAQSTEEALKLFNRVEDRETTGTT